MNDTQKRSTKTGQKAKGYKVTNPKGCVYKEGHDIPREAEKKGVARRTPKMSAGGRKRPDHSQPENSEQKAKGIGREGLDSQTNTDINTDN